MHTIVHSCISRAACALQICKFCSATKAASAVQGLIVVTGVLHASIQVEIYVDHTFYTINMCILKMLYVSYETQSGHVLNGGYSCIGGCYCM